VHSFTATESYDRSSWTSGVSRETTAAGAEVVQRAGMTISWRPHSSRHGTYTERWGPSESMFHVKHCTCHRAMFHN